MAEAERRGGVLLPERRACVWGSAGRTAETMIWKVVPEAVVSPHFRSPVTPICPASFVWVLKPPVSPGQASFSPRTCPGRRAGGSDSHSPHPPGQHLFCALRPTLLVSFAELSAARLRLAGLVWGPGPTLAHRRCPEAGAERCPPASPL